MNNIINKYNGVIPAFYACYDDEGNVSDERTRQLTCHFLKKGVKGVYVCGSSGECIYQSVAERKQTLESVMSQAKGKMTVIAHVACNNTADSRELAAHAESVGVDAIAAIPPIYFKLPEHAIASYWNDISAAAPNTDFMIYNIPQLAGVALTLPLLREMLKNPRVIAVKNSSGPVQDIMEFKLAGGEDFIVFNGPDEQFVAGLAIGATGGIGGTYAAMPELYLEADRLVRAGRVDEAGRLQLIILDLIHDLCACHGNMYAVIKEVLRQNEGVDIGGVRLPLAALTAEDLPKAKAAAEKIRSAINAVSPVAAR